MRKRGIPLPVQLAIAAGAGALVPWAVVHSGATLPDIKAPFALSSEVSGEASASAGPRTACNIKGNVSINTGERIYHVPGQERYDDTIISPQYGERWFCSEAEARAAGWRKVRR